MEMLTIHFCFISRAQWEDITRSTLLKFVIASHLYQPFPYDFG